MDFRCLYKLCLFVGVVVVSVSAIYRSPNLFQQRNYHHLDHDTKFLEKEKQEKIHEIKEKIAREATFLLREEISMNQLLSKRRHLTKDWFWFLDPDRRYEVDRVQLEINDKERAMESILERIDMEWKRLKPLYGIFSKMFLMEAVGFLPHLISVTWGTFSSILELGLLSLLIFGPLTGLFMAITMSIGIQIFPFVIAFSTLVVSMYWIIHFPWIMIQYNPSILEFIAAYATLLTLLIPFVYWIFQLCFPESTKTSLRFFIRRRAAPQSEPARRVVIESE